MENMRIQRLGHFFIFLAFNILYFITYHILLGVFPSIFGIALLALVFIFYCMFHFTSRGRVGITARLALVFCVLFFGLINFIHYKVFKTFIFFGKGFVISLNFAQASLLSEFFYLLPLLLVVISLLLLCVYIEYEFYDTFLLKRRNSFLLGGISLASIFCLSFFIVQNPKVSWSSTSTFHTDLGPIGYIFPQMIKNFFPQNSVIASVRAKTPSIPDSRKVLTELSNLQNKENKRDDYTLPDFLEKPDILIYQLESVPQWAVQHDPTPMPFLKKLMDENITVEHFYPNDCHTVGSEFSSMCGLMPDSREIISSKTQHPEYECFPELVNKILGYEPSVYHANFPSFWNREVLMPLWGFQDMFFSPYFRPKESDTAVLHSIMEHNKNSQKPQFDYFIGFTSHAPHTEKYMYINKIDNGLIIEPFTGVLNEVAKNLDLPEDELRNYFGFLKVVDEGIENFFNELENSGKLEKTIVVLYGDHRYYGFQDKQKYFKEFNELPFVMFVPGMKATKIPITASHIDISQTLFDLLGRNDLAESGHFIGQSIFSSDHMNQAVGKCADEAYLIQDDVIIEGNINLKTFDVIFEKEPLGQDTKQKYFDTIFEAIVRTDELLSYPHDYVFSDGTLLRGSTLNVFALQGGMKRQIMHESTFKQLGFEFINVMRVSEEKLSEFPSHEPVETVEDYYFKKPKSVTQKSILRPNSQGIQNNRLVAHALGAVDDVSGCNCLEAFEQSYKLGFRLFEIDLSLTSDGQVVAFHEGNEPNISLEKSINTALRKEFMEKKFLDEYTLLDIDALLELLELKPDTFLILDTKEQFDAILPKIVQRIKERNPSLIERIIPQIYQKYQLEAVKKLYPFDDIIFTLYLTELTDDELIKFLKSSPEIGSVTMTWDTRFNRELSSQLEKQNIATFVHTVNDNEKIKDFLQNRIGVYTDFYGLNE